MFNNQNESLTGNACYRKAALIKGSSTTISTVHAGSLNLEINGLMYGPTAAAANFGPTAWAVPAANSSASY